MKNQISNIKSQKLWFWFLVTGFWLLFSISGGSLKAQDVSIAYVDLSKIFDSYQKTIDYDKQLEKLQRENKGQRQKLVDEIKKLQDNLALLNRKEQEKQGEKIHQKKNELKEYDRKVFLDLRKKRDEKMKEILKDIEQVVRDYAKKKNLKLILNDRILLYGEEKLDITEDVIEILNKRYK